MGVKRTRGNGLQYDEVKKQTNLSLTRTAVKSLDAIAKERGISRSELVEQIGRGIIPLADQTTPQQSREAERHISTEQTSNQEYSVEFTTEQQILHLSDWERLPDSQGVYIIYVREGDYTSYLRCSLNMKQRFMTDLGDIPKLQEFLGLKAKAYLIWVKCSDRKLLPKIEADLKQFCQDLSKDQRLRWRYLQKPGQICTTLMRADI